MLRYRAATFFASFNTCSSCEEQHISLLPLRRLRKFQYMLLLRGATFRRVFIRSFSEFQYMLLLRGATDHMLRMYKFFQFQYMLLLRGATGVI